MFWFDARKFPVQARLLLTRGFVGFAIGGSVVSYTLFAEYSPVSSRGKMLLLEQSCWSAGTLLSVLLAWVVLSNMPEEIGWRWYVGLSTTPLWIICLLFTQIPESPRYYSATGQFDLAEMELRRMFEANGKKFIDGEIKKERAEEKRGHIMDLFVPVYCQTSIIMLYSSFAVTFCYYGICFLSERIFVKSGKLYLNIFITTLSELPSLFIGIRFLDITGRKWMIVGSWLIYVVATGLIFVTSRGPLDVPFVFLSRCTSQLGFSVIYIYFSEYYPTVIRSTAIGVGSSLGRLAGIATTFVAWDLSIGFATGIFACVALLAMIAGTLLPKDTTGENMKDRVNREKAGELDLSDFETTWNASREVK